VTSARKGIWQSDVSEIDFVVNDNFYKRSSYNVTSLVDSSITSATQKSLSPTKPQCLEAREPHTYMFIMNANIIRGLLDVTLLTLRANRKYYHFMTLICED
jgi:hypothetical protein